MGQLAAPLLCLAGAEPTGAWAGALDAETFNLSLRAMSCLLLI